jgi:hypothetical protein
MGDLAVERDDERRIVKRNLTWLDNDNDNDIIPWEATPPPSK